ncbi:PREDICTED: serine/threonine-protein kinase 3-like [Papilio polytes]|uniref:serine/threonine-protein kinase 3-like n=1 Tax=Papilio polytes TaxID=76194 RepID=UPI00067655D0|nr:PREDICTED: serine/threonine-protein kinase 3-like [Papilio polytes]
MDAEGRLVFWKSGLWEGGAPTLTCNTCKKRRADRMTANERMLPQGELKKLSEESLTRQPEEVFDIICKLGEGSYGSVYKALHKESGQVLAIKQVPVDTDLQEIIKEISIMQQCDSPYVVKYYGSYFKNTDLWIVMEYCGAGSVSDIMRLRKKTLSEDEIATILIDTLKGLEYLHRINALPLEGCGKWCSNAGCGVQLAYLSEGELEARMARLDAEMEAEIEQLRARYDRKRRPILDAIHLKRKRQQNF